ncbi:aminoacyl-tRNA deacylase [Oleiharenicola sp. Vm1]|uniref:aminoacyl-tRNA deacylase n=1 Tax=Oleiharenicola sp. Vm1 TaxID=3398393 RepID=UPI0039F4C95E
MPAAKVKEFLDSHRVKYVSLQHSPAFTAAEVAQSTHVSGRDFAKTVIVVIEDEMVMLVLPASRRVLLNDLREMLDSTHLRLATEAEFRDRFPDCELGAMPPFGNLYDMRVYVSALLAEEKEIAFNAGTHTEVIKMSYADFDRLVKPVVLDFITT